MAVKCARKGAPAVTGACWVCGRELGRLILVDVGDGLADGGVVDDALLLGEAGHEGGGADLVVDASWQPLSVIEDAGDGIVGEEGTGGVAGNPNVVFDVAGRLLEVHGAEMVADGDPLGEGLVDSEEQGATEVGVAHQEEGGQVAASALEEDCGVAQRLAIQVELHAGQIEGVEAQLQGAAYQVRRHLVTVALEGDRRILAHLALLPPEEGGSEGLGVHGLDLGEPGRIAGQEVWPVSLWTRW